MNTETEEGKTESEMFGELVGLIEMNNMEPSDAVETAVERFDGDRETYESLVDKHWSDEGETDD